MGVWEIVAATQGGNVATSEQISQHASENSVNFVTCGGSVESGMCQMTISAETPTVTLDCVVRVPTAEMRHPKRSPKWLHTCLALHALPRCIERRLGNLILWPLTQHSGISACFCSLLRASPQPDTRPLLDARLGSVCCSRRRCWLCTWLLSFAWS